MAHASPHAATRARGFTLTELIAVITIIVILLAVSIPAFRSTIASSESSNVETQLRLALLSGRDAALHSQGGADSAVVFTYEPGGRINILICEHVGTMVDRSLGAGRGVRRDIFVPNPAFEPVQLAAGWLVHGLAPAGSLAGPDNQWYEETSGRRFGSNPERERHWVFPETGFYDALRVNDGANRQTFMIRFEGGVGSVALGGVREALVVSPRPTAAGRSRRPYSDYRLDATADLASAVRRALLRDDWQRTEGIPDPLTDLFGDRSGDTILARSVEQLALYKAGDLANALGIKLNADTGVFYAPENEPTLDPRRGRDDFYERLRLWVEGNTNLDGQWIYNDPDDVPVARLYTVQRYTGRLMPVPLLDLAGASR